MATRVGRLGSEPVSHARCLLVDIRGEEGAEVSAGRGDVYTVALGQFLCRDGVVLWRVQLDWYFGGETFRHCGVVVERWEK